MNASSSLGGTGSSLARAVVIVSGVSSLVASLLSLVSIWLQTKNYRKPLLQRYVVRILLMVPIYAASSWTSIVSLKASLWLDPIRDIYEAFTIYTFFQLLINFLGGERALIIMTHGRPPVSHAWPLNHFLPKVDISDPHTFLAVKRGILQYTWLKPILALIFIIMKATDTYQEGYLGLNSGYLWTGLVYNLSVTVSLYSLAMFWVCMYDDLLPFRPVPKFLCVKLIIFASYWQGFFLSILQWLGALSNGAPGYTPDNLAAAIQDSLICFEMPIFAVAHWYGFSWHDYADPTVSAARMPVKYALRDAFGVKDLIEDTKMTVKSDNYQYRLFDSGDNIIAHAESDSRLKRVMDGMRYERGGKAKYWIPKPGEVNSRTPLLVESNRLGQSSLTTRGPSGRFQPTSDVDDIKLDEEDERLFQNARNLEFGDWNYPVITASELSQEQRLYNSLSYQQSSQSSAGRRAQRHKKSSSSGKDSSRRGSAKGSFSKRSRKQHGDRPSSLQQTSNAVDSMNSRRSQLVDLVVQDREAEHAERIEAQKAFGSAHAAPAPERQHFWRPSDQPIEPSNSTGAEAADNARLNDEDEEDDNPTPQNPGWEYQDLGEDNVWTVR